MKYIVLAFITKKSVFTIMVNHFELSFQLLMVCLNSDNHFQWIIAVKMYYFVSDKHHSCTDLLKLNLDKNIAPL